LNGTRRSSGYVGQDTLGRSLVRSLSKNGALKGHGGCCGQYPTPEIKTTPEMSCLNNPSIVKSSSLNTNGLLMSRYRWIRRPQPYSITKPSNNLNMNDQASYIDNLVKTELAKDCHVISTTVPKLLNCSTTNYNKISQNVPHIVKSDKYTGALNSSEHIRSLDSKCAINNIFTFPRNASTGIGSIPFACGGN
jgi:hypothetical protein